MEARWNHFTESDGDALMLDMVCTRFTATQRSSALEIANGVIAYPCTFYFLGGFLKYQKYNRMLHSRHCDKEDILDLHRQKYRNKERVCLSSINLHTRKVAVLRRSRHRGKK